MALTLPVWIEPLYLEGDRLVTAPGSDVEVAVRPERLQIAEGGNGLQGELVDVIYLGSGLICLTRR